MPSARSAGTVRFGRDARVSGRVAAPNVQLAVGVQTGSLFCHFVSGPPPLPGCMAFTDPLVDPALLQPVAVVPGSADLVVRAGTGTAPVPAGSFRDVRVGRGALLQLAGGAYTAQSLLIGARARIECVDPCVIDVLDTIRLKRRAHLGAAVATRANTVRVNVAVVGGTALLARPRANVAATIFAPGSGIVLGSRGEYRGAFVGSTVTVGPDAIVRHDSAL